MENVAAAAETPVAQDEQLHVFTPNCFQNTANSYIEESSTPQEPIGSFKPDGGTRDDTRLSGKRNERVDKFFVDSSNVTQTVLRDADVDDIAEVSQIMLNTSKILIGPPSK